MIQKTIRLIFAALGYRLSRLHDATSVTTALPDIPDRDCYTPLECNNAFLFRPWLRDKPFNDILQSVLRSSLVSADRCHVLWTLARQSRSLSGDFFECGVYKGGTARLLAEIMASTGDSGQLHLFDTFAGMPSTGGMDIHQRGDFSDTSLEQVRNLVGHDDRVQFHPGFVPDTFVGLDHIRIAFAHVDVDIFQSVMDCCAFIYPRLVEGAFMVFDDYGFPTCPGARQAVDTFFADKPERPLVLPTGQAVVFRSPHR